MTGSAPHHVIVICLANRWSARSWAAGRQGLRPRNGDPEMASIWLLPAVPSPDD